MGMFQYYICALYYMIGTQYDYFSLPCLSLVCFERVKEISTTENKKGIFFLTAAISILHTNAEIYSGCGFGVDSWTFMSG